MTTLILAVSLAILVSALCSLLESVLYSTRVVTLEARAAEGSAVAEAMRALKHEIDRPLSAILILNTLANTAGAALAGWAAGQVWGADALWAFSLIFTLAILIFSEILPKTVGAVFWRSLWPLAVFPLKGMIALLWPLIWLVRFITGLITLRGRKTQLISEDEIIAAAKMGARGGEISHTEAELIRNVIRLEELRARDIMTPRTVVLTVDGARTISEVQAEAEQWPDPRVPVRGADPEQFIGYVLRHDLCSAGAARANEPVASLARPVRFAAERVSALTLLNRFLSRREHLALVADEYGGMAGLVTLEDVFESLVGKEIVDEKDQTVDTQLLARERGQAVIAATEDEPDPEEEEEESPAAAPPAGPGEEPR